MTRAVRKTVSPRHGFAFDLVPTIRGAVWGGGDVYPNGCYASRPSDDYGLVLDTVFEMTDQVSSGNGVTPAAAIETVLRDEGWRILPRHKAEIVKRLSAS